MVTPMLLEETSYDENVFQKYANWIWQEKQNGIRGIVSIKDGKITSIRNRSNNPILHLFPELKKLTFEGVTSAVIDCEVCVMEKDKSIFYGGINQRDKKLYENRIETHPVTIVAFDCLHFNGETIVGKTYVDRLSFLNKVSQSENFKIANNIQNPVEYWKDKVVVENREGLVIKNPKALYEAGTRSKEMLKLKFYKRAKLKVENIESNPKGVKLSGHFDWNDKQCEAEVQWSSSGYENIKIGDEVEFEFLDLVNDKAVQPHKVKGATA